MREEAVWHRQGKVLKGHGEIRAALDERPRTQRIRHVVTNAFSYRVGQRKRDARRLHDSLPLRRWVDEILSRHDRGSVSALSHRDPLYARARAFRPEQRITPEFEFARK